MSGLQKIATLVVFVGLATSLTLPGRQTVPVIGAVRALVTGTLGTAMGTAKQATA